MRLYTKDYLNFKVIDDQGNCVKEIVGVEGVNRALPGDEVTENGSLKKRARHPPIVGVLQFKNKIRYGFTSRNVPIYLFEPLNKGYPYILVSSTEKDLSNNVLAVVQFEAWEDTKFPRGSLSRILGPCGSQDAEAESLLLRYSPLSYPKKFDLPVAVSNESLRTNIGGTTFNIDPPGCEDVDDVFTVELTHTGRYKIWVSITDVASAIQEDSVLDLYARSVGQTLYPVIQKPKHMLPPSIGIEHLSLLPGKRRQCISLMIDWSPQSGITDKQFKLTNLAVDKAFTYDEADKTNEWYMGVIKALCGSIRGSTQESSHDWVETLMIFYNTEFGKLLREHNTGILRSHDAPDLEKLEKWATIDPSLKMLAYTSAKYTPGHTQTSHWGLSSDSYAHASSPLRRYADLYNQRCFYKILSGSSNMTPQALCKNLNLLEKDSKAFQRDSFFMSVLSQETINVEGIFIEHDTLKQKARVWVPSWKRIISVPCRLEHGKIVPRDGTSVFDIKIGDHVDVSYSLNYDSARWKERILFRIVSVIS
jgi:exoribonuclease R